IHWAAAEWTVGRLSRPRRPRRLRRRSGIFGGIAMSSHWVCVHGHFYQPSRENPWLDAVPLQDSAAPYHDWNERVTAECYARNAAARIQDDTDRIVRIVNSYTRISFDVGPTLFRWLARHAPDVYAAILEGDRVSRQAHSGHGNAIAQAYNHVIMPLSSPRDQVTQVVWGIKDFERRFRRFPEGMWLPEAAVDLATLEVLAAQRIAFTVLAPHQAWRMRGGPETPWLYISDGKFDTTVPYRCRLPSGRSMVLFFYDAAVSRGVAFEALLNDGGAFAQRLAAPVPDGGRRVRAVATDGESYGHHHRFGALALAFALQQLAAGAGGRRRARRQAAVGTPTPGHVDAGQRRLVLRRHLGAGDRPHPEPCRAGNRSGASLGGWPGGAVCRSAAGRAGEYSRRPRWRGSLRTPCPAAGGPGAAPGRDARDDVAGRAALSRGCPGAGHPATGS